MFVIVSCRTAPISRRANRLSAWAKEAAGALHAVGDGRVHADREVVLEVARPFLGSPHRVGLVEHRRKQGLVVQPQGHLPLIQRHNVGGEHPLHVADEVGDGSEPRAPAQGPGEVVACAGRDDADGRLGLAR